MKKVTCIAMALLVGMAGLSVGSVAALTLEQRVHKADVIVEGEIGKVETRKFSITYYKDGSNGTEPAYTTYYDLAQLKVATVHKGQRPGLVNKADRANPVDWMSIAYHSKDQKSHPFRHELVHFNLNQKGIWFLKRDVPLTGLHFVTRCDNLVPTEKGDQINELLQAERARKRENAKRR